VSSNPQSRDIPGSTIVAQRLEALVRPPSEGSLYALSSTAGSDIDDAVAPQRTRDLAELVDLFEEAPTSVKLMNDGEVILLSQKGKIPLYNLEKILGDYERAVVIRRAIICESSYPCCSRCGEKWF
jgi:hypothetical protein